MNIIPAGIEEKINRVDRQPSLAIGISLGLLAAWSFYRVIWLLYVSMTFGWFMGSVAFQFVLWVVTGAVAAVAAAGFLIRYFRGPDADH
ncbi:hypothetical protein A4G26_24080 [Mycobacterium kansasii]|uniref:Uncharacterized protein n=1 Tax=Mycobacterium innocens TaxID=2341083 RepID=A0A498Q6A1_9MYCO|nr:MULTISPECIES: hypothetical protein [Mycobacterium]KZS72819.1 hypothetical protein A4G26_24080 [Mycobacterium kansasii]VBA39915.1 hypothetical protein LAUMK13_02825 [Mycobacterium innocens]